MGGMSPQQAISLYDSSNPVMTEGAFRTSNYSAFIDGSLVRLLDWREPSGLAKMTHNAFRAFVLSDGFSCVGAKGAVQSGGYRFGFYHGFPSRGAADGIVRDVAAFVAELPFMQAKYKTFVAVFHDSIFDERAFERALWEQLQELHEVDRRYFAWDPAASKNPADPSFAMSLAGHRFFVVGMHPGASRLSRRFAFPALVFNSHDQFDELKASGHFARIQELVRERELALQGSLNPNLADYGVVSEARQYAGKPEGDTWACPFRPH